jgi:hypothetical protein
MRLVGVAVAFVVAIAVPASCAKRSEQGSNTGDTGAQTAGEGGSGGVGGEGAGGQGGAGGEGGSLPECKEKPCKLVPPQCGCDVGQRCALLGSLRSCQPAGDRGKGQSCKDGFCAAGLHCFSQFALGIDSICAPYCDDHGDCDGAGAKCVFALGGVVTTAKLCSVNCDPVTNTGCKAPNSHCSIYQQSNMPFTACATAGKKVHGESCSSSSDCGAGTECFTVNMGTKYCLKWCNLGSPSCPGNAECVPLNPPQVIGSVQYGACLDFGF